MWLTLLWYSLYCSGLKLNQQSVWGTPVVICLDCLPCAFQTWIIRRYRELKGLGHWPSLSLVCLNRFVKETCLGVSNQYITYEKWDLCTGNRLNPGHWINENPVLVIRRDLFLGSRWIHIKICRAAMCKFLGFRLVVSDLNGTRLAAQVLFLTVVLCLFYFNLSLFFISVMPKLQKQGGNFVRIGFIVALLWDPKPNVQSNKSCLFLCEFWELGEERLRNKINGEKLKL